MHRSLILGALALALPACMIRSSGADLATGDETDPVVVSRACRDVPDDPVRLTGMTVEGRTLRVGVQHGGGCAPHTFAACWDGTVLDSAPPRLRLVVRHDAHGDSCDALISHDVRIDLADLDFDFSAASIADPDGTIELVGR